MPTPSDSDGGEIACAGPSMSPLLASGDLIRYARAAPAELALGDVIVVLWVGPRGPELLVHRLVWKRRRGGSWSLWTKGDANPLPDPETRESGLVGKVVAVKKGDGPWRGLGRWGQLWTGLRASAAVAARYAARNAIAGAYTRLSRAPRPRGRAARRALMGAMVELERRLPRGRAMDDA